MDLSTTADWLLPFNSASVRLTAGLRYGFEAVGKFQFHLGAINRRRIELQNAPIGISIPPWCD